MSLAQSSARLFSARLLSSLIKIIGLVLFARVLGAAEIGIYFLFLAILGLVSIGADFGINSAITKRISEETAVQEHLGAAIILKLVTISSVSVVIVVLRGPLHSYLGDDLAVILILAVWIQQFAQLAIHTLHGELRVGETAGLEVSRQVTWLLVGGGLVYLNFGYIALIFGTITGHLLALLIAVYRIDIRLARPERVHFESLGAFSRYSVISSMGGYAYSWVDILVIGYFLSSAHVGAYEVAWRITGLFIVYSRSIGTALFPQISQWSTNSIDKRIETVLPKATFATTIVSVPAFFGSLVLSSEILTVMFGAEYAVAAVAFQVLMLENIFQSVHKVWGYSLQALDKPDQAAGATLLSLAINVVLNVLLIPPFGLVGAASATAISFGVNTGIHAFYLSRQVRLGIPYRRLSWCLVSSLLMLSVVYGVARNNSISSSFALFGLVAIGAALYFLILIIYPPIRIDIRSLARAVV